MHISPPPHHFRLRTIALLVITLLGGCAQYDPLLQAGKATPIPAPLVVRAPAQGEEGSAAPTVASNAGPRTAISGTPRPPQAMLGNAAKPSEPPSDNEKADISLVFDQLALPAFINTVYGVALKTNFSVDPKVLERKDLVTLRTSKPQTRTELLRTAQMLLKSYGITVNDVGGFYRIVPDNTQAGYLPEIRRGRTLPDVPLALRPIFQFVEMNAVRSTDARNWLNQMFGTRLTLADDAQHNALMISGQTDDIRAALDVIRILDQPLMRGRNSQRISPLYWSVDDLARKLAELLAAEGYLAQIGMTPGGVNAPVILIPVAATNSIVVFAGDDAILKHIVDWASDLDQPTRARGNNGYFTYPVLNLDADDLAKTVQEVLSSTPVAAATGSSAATTKAPARVVVHKPTNTLIIQGSADQYAQWIGLLKELDQPAKSALIEMTVAEVSLTDSLNLGVEWAFSHGGLSGGTLGGLGLGTGGLALNYVNGNIRAALNALASDNRAQILSSPRIMARNGETATISVGQQVPILTSQQSTSSIAPGTAGVLQTIQYKDTGIILKVRPVIHAGGRIDVDVSQEVSAASTTTTGVSNSPTFSNRKIDTKLSIQDGATVMLGGLISDNNSRGNSGIPLIKDIPVMGALFRTQTGQSNKQELIILITPYIIEDNQTAQSITQSFRTQLGPWTAAATNPAPIVLPARSAPATVLPIPDSGANTTPAASPAAATTPIDAPTVPGSGANATPAQQPAAAQPVTDPAVIEQIRALQKRTKP